MDNNDRNSLSERFKKSSSKTIAMASDPKFMTAAFALGLLTMPLSTTVGLIMLSTPTIYVGVGSTYRLAASAIKNKTANGPY